MKNFIRLSSIIFGLALVFTFISCGDDAVEPEPEGTFTKELLLDKHWITEDGAVEHKFNTDGTYFDFGLWIWGDDQKSVVTSEPGGSRTWHISHNTTTSAFISHKPDSTFTEYRVKGSW